MEKTINVGFFPKQRAAFESDADELLMGGAAGPGKTHLLWNAGCIHCLQYPGAHAILFRRTYPEIEKNFVPRAEAIDPALGKFTGKLVRWTNGSRLWLSHLERASDVMQHQSSEYSLIGFDELTTFEEGQYTYLTSRNRPPKPGIPCRVISATNPIGIGRAWVKARFVDIGEWGKVHRFEIDDPVVGKLVKTRQFIPSTIEDNPILMADPGYLAWLNMLPENEKRALRFGDWDVGEGVAFPEFMREVHLIEPFNVKKSWYKVLSMDWGRTDPFDIQVWTQDPSTGAVFMIKEVYGCKYEMSDIKRDEDRGKGVGWNASTVARYIKSRILNKYHIDKFVAHKIWSKTKDETSISTDFEAEGIHFQRPRTDDRVTGKQKLHELLAINHSSGVPNLRIFNTCKGFARILPGLVTDDRDIEDVKKSGLEDHPYDNARYAAVEFDIDKAFDAPVRREDDYSRKFNTNTSSWKVN